jgi:hypothetical protein
MSAKNAELNRTGSHWVSDDNSCRSEGISKEEVYFYFSATWRGQPVQVEVSADRYAHTSGMSEWRVYARAARFYDPERNGGRGEETTETARSALSNLCSPIATDWLKTDAYTVSFQTALANMVIRKFRDDYSASRRVAEALNTFKGRLSPAAYQGISETLDAYNAYEAIKARTDETISAEATS